MNLKKIKDAISVLNLYRNQNYNAPLETEEQCIAKALDDILPYLAKKITEDEYDLVHSVSVEEILEEIYTK